MHMQSHYELYQALFNIFSVKIRYQYRNTKNDVYTRPEIELGLNQVTHNYATASLDAYAHALPL
jgi:hypothetical protein